MPRPRARVTRRCKLVDVDPMSAGPRTSCSADALRARHAPRSGGTPTRSPSRPPRASRCAPHTRYAIVVTNDLHARGRRELPARRRPREPSSPSTPSNDPLVTAARRPSSTPALDELAGLGITRRAACLTLTVFTTFDPGGGSIFRAADWLLASGPTPTLVDSTPDVFVGGFHRLTGHYGPSPNFQTGQTPYNETGSGGFTLDSAGVPQVQRTEKHPLRPRRPRRKLPPPHGWPLAIYAHGTGGSYVTFIQDGTAAAATAHGVAMLGFDQVFHGGARHDGNHPRDGLFFNFLNPEAGAHQQPPGGARSHPVRSLRAQPPRHRRAPPTGRRRRCTSTTTT